MSNDRLMNSHAMAFPGPTFMQVPAGQVDDVVAGGFAIIGAPFGSAYTVPGIAPGAARAPHAIRSASARYHAFAGRYDFDLQGPFFDPAGVGLLDLGDCFGPVHDPSQHVAIIEETVRSAAVLSALPIVLGGDDSTPIPICAGLDAFTDIHVLQIDAHLDYRDNVDGHRCGYSSPMRRIREMSHVAKIVHVGARGIGSAHVSDHDDTLEAGNAIVTAREVVREGVGVALQHFPDGANVYISIDCDGFDPSVMPGTSVPLPGGLQFYDGVDMIRDLVSRCNLRGIGFAEHYPEFDNHNLTSVAITRLISNTIGATLSRRQTAKEAI
ncbi:arginase family protein [Paracoccus sp. Z330]|uniref:Arginase family protein n=1 Tax=Paracoccus onchidii TaxID=3017813 RepID=A0ABT4ZA26_9RHOB|nr:arginase family protein [Paracoccus onchidii]MDB6176201.1 arginase family protein [Paracoccus onchidii]